MSEESLEGPCPRCGETEHLHAEARSVADAYGMPEQYPNYPRE